ncbi:hypothetical protein ACQPZP_41525 [Spirillospora sp. CA-142024]|uniref:hypothetical protein n=1 Tax=Spirillospora sp. CA-142024 TaxID=3240036 RepID=UPI003D8A116E
MTHAPESERAQHIAAGALIIGTLTALQIGYALLAAVPMCVIGAATLMTWVGITEGLKLGHLKRAMWGAILRVAFGNALIAVAYGYAAQELTLGTVATAVAIGSLAVGLTSVWRYRRTSWGRRLLGPGVAMANCLAAVAVTCTALAVHGVASLPQWLHSPCLGGAAALTGLLVVAIPALTQNAAAGREKDLGRTDRLPLGRQDGSRYALTAATSRSAAGRTTSPQLPHSESSSRNAS